MASADMRVRKGFPGAGLTAVFLTVFMFLFNGETVFSEVEMTGFRIAQETDSGRWEIRADKAYYDNLGDVILHAVDARMVKDNVQGVTVKSDRGRYESSALILHLEGNVRVTSVWGYRFEAPNLRWDGPRAVMIAEGGVEIERGELKVRGASFRYTPDTGTALVDGGVKTTWYERSTRR